MPNTKFINDPEKIVDELLQGFVIAHSDKINLEGSNLVVRANKKPADKVAVVTIGGSGHEPALRSGLYLLGILNVVIVGSREFSRRYQPQKVRIY